ncbi:hypothetical protein ACJ73_04489 [Blastomyces percursus]|uniref:Uncharacterized protein n=1 Tax=Blastomyces percursus TaxID=1658174 RepID=A0A1J9Q7V7_9EURO|nr:hypothetical protein ACJ73_04489 [Blastomyces percursus]
MQKSPFLEMSVGKLISEEEAPNLTAWQGIAIPQQADYEQLGITQKKSVGGRSMQALGHRKRR